MGVQFHMGALIVIFVDLIRQEEHAVALEEALAQAVVEGMRVHGHGNAVHDMPCHHAVEKQIVLPFRNKVKFTISIPIRCYRDVTKMLADKLPCHFGISRSFLESAHK